MSKELKRPNKKDYYDLLGGFMPVIWDRDVKEYIDQLEAKLKEAEERNKKLLNAMLEKSKNYSIKPLAPSQSDFYKGAKWMKEELEKALNKQALNKETEI